ncbi:DNA_repair helicase TFIIH P90 [Hexamita inflata]|uniref:DNA 3'-5' helicase n=1 Tax=Hexamita inflata TaxID=28002 RepID=A0AA86N9S6_9EUKA|nr:DNA repair helicase TFIIH P90 [Hexamita inflata]CAI9938668.1 DNA repair helicase TFIIH P90 [Hexamita inflata]
MNQNLGLKPNSEDYPLTIFHRQEVTQKNQDKLVFIALVETFNRNYDLKHPEKYNELINFIVSIAEPESRPQYIHEYIITDATLKAATQVGYTIEQIRENLDKYSKYQKLPQALDLLLQNLESAKNFISISLLDVNNYIVRLPPTFPHLDEFTKPIYDMMESCAAQDEYFSMLSQNIRFVKQIVKVDDISKFRERLQKPIGQQQYSVIEEYYLPVQQAPISEVNIKNPVKTWKGVPPNYYTFYKLDKKYKDLIDPSIQQAFQAASLYEKHAPYLNADLKSTTLLRTYQKYAVDKIVADKSISRFNQKVSIKKLNSGMIVLPCGSGKSLQGIATSCRISRSCLIVTNGNLSNLQWKNQYLQFTTIDENRVFVFQADDEDKGQPRKLFIPGYHTVLIATFNMLTNSTTAYSSVIRQLIKAQVWGIVLFDEAHQMFAKTFRTLFMSGQLVTRKQDGVAKEEVVDNFIRSYCKVGLTATPLREDTAIKDSMFYLGCKLFESNWSDLSKQGYIADLNCVEVQCSITRYFYEKYLLCHQKNATEIYKTEWISLKREMQQKELKQNHDTKEKFIELQNMPVSYSKKLSFDMNQNQGSIIGKQTLSLIIDDPPQFDRSFFNTLKSMLGIFNPEKLRVASMLKNYHVAQGHQVLIFCDSVVAAEIYSRLLKIPFVKGDVPGEEREVIVEAFLERKINCFLLTRVGDTSLDLPDANVLIEIDWQSKSRRQETQRIGRISRPKHSGYQGFFYVLVSEATGEVESAAERRSYLTTNQGYSYSSIEDSEIKKIMKETKVDVDANIKDLVEEDLYHEVLYLSWMNKKNK